MIAVAGGILLALLIIFLLIGFCLAVRDSFKFLSRHKAAAGIVAISLCIWGAVTVAGLYSEPYHGPPSSVFAR